MTLHWWMHWFWVTVLITFACSYPSLGAPQFEELQHISETATRHTGRQDRAMYFPKLSTTNKPFIINITDVERSKELPETSLTSLHDLSDASTPELSDDLINYPFEVSASSNTTQNIRRSELRPLDAEDLKPRNFTKNETEIVHPAIQWTPINSSVTPILITTGVTETTTMTDIEPTESTKVTNMTYSNATVAKKMNSTLTDLVKDDLGVEGVVSESRIVTQEPLSLETSYRQTRTQQSSNSNPNIESYRRVDPGFSMDTGAIAGVSFAALVLAALGGSTAFVLYRRRYLNKPQTLNDKCSNPDSSGYLDDSTVRDNSEEMYSLDNDSFLNSLEAMTIQNYWTDTVKHTKL